MWAIRQSVLALIVSREDQAALRDKSRSEKTCPRTILAAGDLTCYLVWALSCDGTCPSKMERPYSACCFLELPWDPCEACIALPEDVKPRSFFLSRFQTAFTSTGKPSKVSKRNTDYLFLDEPHV
jgi:hypothetical protein